MRRGARGSGIPVDPDRVRAARLEAGLSLRDIAGDDVSATFVHFVERGVSRPSRDVLSLIARRTGKPIEYFLAPSSSKVQPPSDLAAELAQVGDHVHKLERARHLSADDRAVLRFIELTIRQSAGLLASMKIAGPTKAKRAGRRSAIASN